MDTGEGYRGEYNAQSDRVSSWLHETSSHQAPHVISSGQMAPYNSTQGQGAQYAVGTWYQSPNHAGNQAGFYTNNSAPMAAMSKNVAGQYKTNTKGFRGPHQARDAYAPRQPSRSHQRPISSRPSPHGKTRVAKRGRPSKSSTSQRLRDEENLLISKLRVQSLMDWPNIVDYMNNWRSLRGLEPSLTDAAVYGRFKRNGSALFAKAGLPTFEPSTYMHLKNAREWVGAGQHGAPALYQPQPPSYASQYATYPKKPKSSGMFVPQTASSTPSTTEMDTSRSSSAAVDGQDADHDADGDSDPEYHTAPQHQPTHTSQPAVNDGPEKSTFDPNPTGCDPKILHQWFTHAVGVVAEKGLIQNLWADVAAILKDQHFPVDPRWCHDYFHGYYLVGTPSDPSVFPALAPAAKDTNGDSVTMA